MALLFKRKKGEQVKETKVSFGSGIFSTISSFFRTVMSVFNFAAKKQERKMQEFPLREEEHKENKGVRLIKVEIEKIDKTKKLVKRYRELEKRANKLNIDIEELLKLPVIDLEYLEHLDKELENEEKELEKELEDLPEDVKEDMKKNFRQKRKERRFKRKNAKGN